MQQIINALIWIGNVVRSFWLPLSVILGFLSDPGGVVTAFVCPILQAIFQFFPSTPEQLKVINMFDDMIKTFDKTFPIIGGGIFNEILSSVSAYFGIIVLVKIYKLIPFKAT
jgi:hypothetical protein